MKWHKNWKQLLKTYSFLSLVGNAFVAISVSGLAVLGVLSPSMAFPVVATAGVILGVVGAAGRLLDQEIEDVNDAE
ncbi:hypothetical protein D3C86_1699120 [compost metagenome]